jgi:hypothetical protein
MNCLHDRFLASEIRRQRICGRQADAHRKAIQGLKAALPSPRVRIFAPFIETRNIKPGFLRLWSFCFTCAHWSQVDRRLHDPAAIMSGRRVWSDPLASTGMAGFFRQIRGSAAKFKRLRNAKAESPA